MQEMSRAFSGAGTPELDLHLWPEKVGKPRTLLVMVGKRLRHIFGVGLG